MTDEQEIRELVSTWQTASKLGDTTTVLSLMTEDVVFLTPGRPPMIGRTAFEAATNAAASSTGTRPQIDGTTDIKEITVFGNSAYLWSHIRVAVTPPTGGNPLIRSGHTITVFRRESGKWMICRDANMLTLEKEPGQ